MSWRHYAIDLMLVLGYNGSEIKPVPIPRFQWGEKLSSCQENSACFPKGFCLYHAGENCMINPEHLEHKRDTWSVKINLFEMPFR